MHWGHCLTRQIRSRAVDCLVMIDVPQEADWHRMIAEAAYYLAQKRGFGGEHSLDDWLAAEQQVRQVISPTRGASALKAGEKAAQTGKRSTTGKPKRGRSAPKDQGTSRFEKFAATQAAGDGIQGEKIGANMADRK
jgi:hypothetical protein